MNARHSGGPLSDIRILAIEQFGAGPYGTSHLAALGADVIKIEHSETGGDVGRQTPPYVEGTDSLYFETFNRSKRSICLDLASADGYRIFRELVKHSDAVFSNLRGDVPARLGITYDALKDANPRIVCCSLSAFGMTGPRAAEPGYDYIIQGMAGWMSLTGEPDGPPAKSGLSVVDFAAGLVAAGSTMAAIHAARRDGVGTDCDVSLFDTAITLLGYVATWQQSRGLEPKRVAHSSHPSLMPFQIFPTSDGWIVVACAKEKFWRRLAPLLDVDGLANDPRFASFGLRRRHSAEFLSVVEPAFKRRTTSEWAELLRKAGIPGGEVNSVDEALRDPQTIARGLIMESYHPTLGIVRQPVSPMAVGPDRYETRRAPFLGEHQVEVLEELLGYDAETISSLEKIGAFGSSVLNLVS